MKTKKEVIAKLVELDVDKWGECERAASQRMNSALSHGLALNKLAHYGEQVDTDLAAAAKTILTDADCDVLYDAV